MLVNRDPRTVIRNDAVTVHRSPFTVHGVVYQLALRTPGIIPNSASSRKQMRQRPKRRRNARARPHRLHRLFTRTANFGFLLLFSIQDFLAIERFGV